jgi:NAD(P)-dependent dehydrogenase (short-subunit alcohol dehydrogenase family)
MAVVVITGGAGALGAGIIGTLLGEGARVVSLDTPSGAERLRKSPRAGLTSIACDVASGEAWASALGSIERDVGAPTGAVLVAGGWQGGKPLHTSDDAVTRAMIAQNFTTAEASMRALLPGMVARRAGAIVVVGSRAAERPWTSAGAAAYAASKAGVVALAQAVAAEVLDSGVRVNAVLPSTIDTPANRHAMPNVDPSTWVAPESIAAVVSFLLSPASRDISGAAIPVYGRA